MIIDKKSDPLAELMSAIEKIKNSSVKLDEDKDLEKIFARGAEFHLNLREIGEQYKLHPVDIDEDIIAGVFALHDSLLGGGEYFALIDDRVILLIHTFVKSGIFCWRARSVPRNAANKDDVIKMPRKQRGNSKRRDINIWTENIDDFDDYLGQMSRNVRAKYNELKKPRPELSTVASCKGETQNPTEQIMSGQGVTQIEEFNPDGQVIQINLGTKNKQSTEISPSNKFLSPDRPNTPDEVIGRLGEQYAFDALTQTYCEKYPDAKFKETANGFVISDNTWNLVELCWHNKQQESFTSPDITIDEVNEQTYWEVKSTHGSDITNFVVTDQEWNLAKMHRGRFFFLRVCNVTTDQPVKISKISDPYGLALKGQIKISRISTEHPNQFSTISQTSINLPNLEREQCSTRFSVLKRVLQVLSYWFGVLTKYLARWRG